MKHTKALIIGSGPAGYTAAIYTARANLQPILIQGMEPGGQLTVTTDVENFPGFSQTIQGPWLMEEMCKQAEHVGTELIFDRVTFVDVNQRPFLVKTEFGNQFTADSIIICTGAQAKWLEIDSEKVFRGFGVSGCATCDGFFFKGKRVAVVGGGNAAVEEALYLTNHATHVTLIHRRDQLRSEKILQDRLFTNSKISVLWNHAIQEFWGSTTPQKKLEGISIQNTIDGTIKKMNIDGVFIAIGHKPQTELFKDILDLDDEGYIVCKPHAPFTKIPGIFAAGDVQDKIYRQAVTAAGQGCMAALEAERFVNHKPS